MNKRDRSCMDIAGVLQKIGEEDVPSSDTPVQAPVKPGGMLDCDRPEPSGETPPSKPAKKRGRPSKKQPVDSEKERAAQEEKEEQERTERASNGRFAPGHTKLGGRQPGSKNRSTLLKDALSAQGMDAAEMLVFVYHEALKQGNLTVASNLATLAVKMVYAPPPASDMEEEIGKFPTSLTVEFVSNEASDLV